MRMSAVTRVAKMLHSNGPQKKELSQCFALRHTLLLKSTCVHARSCLVRQCETGKLCLVASWMCLGLRFHTEQFLTKTMESPLAFIGDISGGRRAATFG